MGRGKDSRTGDSATERRETEKSAVLGEGGMGTVYRAV